MAENGRTFLVTGSNTGIGKATVEAFASSGARIILACRSEEKTRPVIAEIQAKYPASELLFLSLDLASLASVRSSAEKLISSGWLSAARPLDVLVNNAGLAGLAGLTKDGYEVTVGTNHLGPYYFTQLLIPELRRSPNARIVNVASEAHQNVKAIDWESLRRATSGTRQRLAMYGVSKLMNVLHAKELARRLVGSSITTYSLHPGVVASDVWRAVPGPIRWVMNQFML